MLWSDKYTEEHMMKYSCTLTANFRIFQGYVRAVWTG